MNSILMRLPLGSMVTSSPFLTPMRSMTEPTHSEGTSMKRRSIGSHFSPSMVRKMTCGVPTPNS